MNGLEHVLVFLPHAHQLGDLEKAPPVQLGGAGAPPRQPVVLALQQRVQALGSARVARRSHVGHRLGHRLGQRQAVVAITQRGRPARGPLQPERARGQRVPVGVAEDRQQHLAVQRGVGRLPVDVEILRMGAALAVREHVAPPAVVRGIGSHMVRHDVHHQTQPRRAGARGQRQQASFAAQFRVDLREIGDVVAVGGAGARRGDRR
ncbi:hypothetical protein D3C81_1376860 [compost metagenome]